MAAAVAKLHLKLRQRDSAHKETSSLVWTCMGITVCKGLVLRGPEPGLLPSALLLGRANWGWGPGSFKPLGFSFWESCGPF